MGRIEYETREKSETRENVGMGFRLFFILVCFMIAQSSCARRALLDQAQAAWDSRDYEKAAAKYEEFIKDKPQSDQAAAARFKVATIYHRDLKQYDRAIQHYLHLIEYHPKSQDIYRARLGLAECYAATGKKREAISEYENALPFTNDEKEKRRVRVAVADLYYEMDDLGQAVAEYQKVVANPASADARAGYDELSERAYLRIGGIRVLRDEFEDAIMAYRAVAENTVDATLRRVARFGLADCYERTSQYDLAVATLESTEPDPKAPDYIKQRVTLIRDQQRQRNLTTPPPQGTTKRRG